ncbi:MAG TPA: gluconate 2-dehydrogenase subunit 3 family protein, partial [Acetobacteraceae bacterium]
PDGEKGMPEQALGRRGLLASVAFVALGATAEARTIQGARPWSPGTADPPAAVRPGPWVFFTPEEGAAVEALVERLIPADALGAGAREAGCAVFIDRQLAGFFGTAERLYMRPPFAAGTPQQGLQSPLTPAQHYRAALRALDGHVRAAFAGRRMHELAAEQRDGLLAALEKGQLRLEGADGRFFFELLLQNTMEGFFADPIHGGNRDMVGWKLVGFPGTRYDYRDHIAKHNQRYPLPPVGIGGRPDWG